MSEWFKNLVEEIEDDIIEQTKEGYDVGDLITLQSLLMYDLCKTNDQYYLSSDRNIEDLVSLKCAIKDMVRKISWSIYHGYYKDLNWLEEFHRSLEYEL